MTHVKEVSRTFETTLTSLADSLGTLNKERIEAALDYMYDMNAKVEGDVVEFTVQLCDDVQVETAEQYYDDLVYSLKMDLDMPD